MRGSWTAGVDNTGRWRYRCTRPMVSEVTGEGWTQICGVRHKTHTKAEEHAAQLNRREAREEKMR